MRALHSFRHVLTARRRRARPGGSDRPAGRFHDRPDAAVHEHHLGLFGNGLYQIMFIVNLQPVMALLVAWAALGEIPTAAQWGGTGAIIAGVVLTRS
jgi:hypothetical protein